jgi:hypothetical protein
MGKAFISFLAEELVGFLLELVFEFVFGLF